MIRIADQIRSFAILLKIAAQMNPEALMAGLNALKDLVGSPRNFEGATTQLSAQGMRRLRSVPMFSNGPVSLEGVYDTIKGAVGPSQLPPQVKSLVESRFRKAPESPSGLSIHVDSIIEDVQKALQKVPVRTSSSESAPAKNEAVAG